MGAEVGACKRLNATGMRRGRTRARAVHAPVTLHVPAHAPRPGRVGSGDALGVAFRRLWGVHEGAYPRAWAPPAAYNGREGA